MVSYLVAGGGGFIGTNLVQYLLAEPDTSAVVVLDDLTSTTTGVWSKALHLRDNRLILQRGRIEDRQTLERAMSGSDVVMHLAANPDIAAAVSDPALDFRRGTALVQECLEAARRTGVKSFIYLSGSGVYGDAEGSPVSESDIGRFPTISPYAASKVAGECLLSSYCQMFPLQGASLRLANVVGPGQTHGLGYNLVSSYRSRRQFDIWGDGLQSKPYIHVSDVMTAIMLITRNLVGYNVYNVSTSDVISVRAFVEMFLGRTPGWMADLVSIGHGPRAWPGEVPVVRMKTERIEQLGWQPKLTSRQAVDQSILELLGDSSYITAGALHV